MKDKRKQPRWFQHLRAILGGYFWSPCPICGKCFGGHEENPGVLYQGMGEGVMTCVNCSEEASKTSNAVMNFDPIPTRVLR